MESPSELQQFLEAYRDEGDHQDEGEFTVAREKALSKLAEFQLPFAGGWALKVVQSAVAGGAQAIRIDQTYSETRCYFEVPSHWGLSDIEDAFYEPEPSPERPLDHLKRALWSACLNKKRPFQINLPGVKEMLVWTGEKLTRAPSSQSYNCLYLAISHRPASQAGLLGKLDFWTSAESNASVVKALADHAFTCPIPLTVDSRRLDSLQFCPSHGMNRTSHPLALRLLEAELKPLKLSPGTFRESLNREQHYKEPRYRALSCQLPSDPVGEGRETPLAYLVSYHAEKKLQEDRSTRWVDLNQTSVCYWVQDGVCVDQEKFPVPSAPISVAAFISASGIDTDLTSLRLQQTQERSDRLEEARQRIKADIQDVKLDSVRKASMRGNAGSWVGGALLLMGGVACMAVAPPAAALVSLGGGLVLKGAHNEAERFRDYLVWRMGQAREEWADSERESSIEGGGSQA